MHLFLSCLKKEGWFLIGFVEFLLQRSSPPRGKPHTAVTGQSYNKGQVSILGGTELSWGLLFIGLQATPPRDPLDPQAKAVLQPLGECS